MMSIAGLSLASGLAATPLSAQPTVWISNTSGKMLSSVCTSTAGDGKQFDACSAYILGVSDGLALQGAFCAPLSNTASDHVAIVRKYLDQHPAELDKQAATLIKGALAKAFPCK